VNIIAFIAPAVADPLAVGSVVALLVFWAVWSGVQIERRSAKFQNILDSARRRLERAADPAKFAQDYEAIRSYLSARRVAMPQIKVAIHPRSPFTKFEAV
jgi:hypothetical protein